MSDKPYSNPYLRMKSFEARCFKSSLTRYNTGTKISVTPVAKNNPQPNASERG
jgi:hypothetical protein